MDIASVLSAIKERRVIDGTGAEYLYRCAAMVGVDAAKLPATHQVLHGHAAAIQELLTRPERQLINLRDVEDMRSIIVTNGPFGVGIKLVQTPEVEGRKTAVRVRQGLR